MAKVSPIPETHKGVIASVCVDGARKALEFYKKAFGAEVSECMDSPDGKVAHAEIRIAGGLIMLGDPAPQWNVLPTKNARFYFYVEDCDQAVERAVKAGCTLAQPCADQFWGDRMGNVVDPFGFTWGIGTHKEDLTPEEIKKRGEEWMSKMAAGAGAK